MTDGIILLIYFLTNYAFIVRYPRKNSMDVTFLLLLLLLLLFEIGGDGF